MSRGNNSKDASIILLVWSGNYADHSIFQDPAARNKTFANVRTITRYARSWEAESAWSVVTRPILTFLGVYLWSTSKVIHFLFRDRIDQRSFWILVFSCRIFKVFVLGRGWNWKSFISVTSLHSWKCFFLNYCVDTGGAWVNEGSAMLISADGRFQLLSFSGLIEEGTESTGHLYCWLVITRSTLTFFHFRFAINDLHQNSHNVCSETKCFGGVHDISRFSYRYLKVFAGGGGMKLTNVFFVNYTLVNARFVFYRVDIGEASVDEDNNMQISPYGSSIIIIWRFYPGVDKKYWPLYCLGRWRWRLLIPDFTSIGGTPLHTHGTH